MPLEERRRRVDVGNRALFVVLALGGLIAFAARPQAQSAPPDSPSLQLEVSRVRTRGPGQLDQAALERRLERYRSGIVACYRATHATESGAGVRLQFAIEESGRTFGAEILEAEVHQDTAYCILDRVDRWQFDRPRGGTVWVRQAYRIRAPRGAS